MIVEGGMRPGSLGLLLHIQLNKTLDSRQGNRLAIDGGEGIQKPLVWSSSFLSLSLWVEGTERKSTMQ